MAKQTKRKPGTPSKAVARINARLRASAAPAPRKQPTAGQLVGAGIITRQ
jgi:hypothetical protein